MDEERFAARQRHTRNAAAAIVGVYGLVLAAIAGLVVLASFSVWSLGR
jgi:hypothetical protein